eukprot:s1212_g12.t1
MVPPAAPGLLLEVGRTWQPAGAALGRLSSREPKGVSHEKSRFLQIGDSPENDGPCQFLPAGSAHHLARSRRSVVLFSTSSLRMILAAGGLAAARVRNEAFKVLPFLIFHFPRARVASAVGAVAARPPRDGDSVLLTSRKAQRNQLQKNEALGSCG